MLQWQLFIMGHSVVCTLYEIAINATVVLYSIYLPLVYYYILNSKTFKYLPTCRKQRSFEKKTFLWLFKLFQKHYCNMASESDRKLNFFCLPIKHLSESCQNFESLPTSCKKWRRFEQGSLRFYVFLKSSQKHFCNLVCE